MADLAFTQAQTAYPAPAPEPKPSILEQVRANARYDKPFNERETINVNRPR